MTVPVPGVRAVEALLQHAPKRVKELLVCGEPTGQRKRVLENASLLGIAVRTVTPARLEEICGEIRHQGLVAMADPADYVPFETLLEAEHPLLVALDQVTDPRNFGAILRVGEALGATGALVTSNRCARLGPTVSRTSAGASELLPVAMETNLVQSMARAQAAGLQVVGADMDGTPAAEIDWTRPTLLVIGAEGKGLRRLTRERCDAIASIPMTGMTESLNASVAAAILIYEAAQQRSRQSKK